VLRRGSALVAVLALLSACSGTGPQSSITVGGQPVPSHGVSTVEQALKEAGVKVPAGRLLAIKSHRPIGPDLRPGKVLVDGVVAGVGSPVEPGAVITVQSGGDAVEAVETVLLPQPANGGIATLRKGARAGQVRVVRGTVSHEVVSRRVTKKPYDGVLLSARPIALTFDDGPSPQYTTQVLAMLSRARVHATFCLVGREAVKHPELVKAIVAGGHTLCNHSWDHDEHLAQRPASAIVAEMKKTQDAIFKIVGEYPRFFRAPGGSFSPQVDLIARSMGMTPLKWTVDPQDWRKPGTGRIIANVMAHARPGAIVLLHDAGGRREQTIAALGYFLARLPAYHFAFWTPQPAI
jgi:peptidoglycan/xylan/chitin deacetylase (PgdA/CDA1 family)